MVTVLVYIPLTQLETLYISFTIIFNCGVFGYSINEGIFYYYFYYITICIKKKVGNILNEINRSNQEYNR